MTLRINIPGGYASGLDEGRKFRTASATEPKPDWRCSQGHENPGYCLRCMTHGCNEKRP